MDLYRWILGPLKDSVIPAARRLWGNSAVKKPQMGCNVRLAKAYFKIFHQAKLAGDSLVLKWWAHLFRQPVFWLISAVQRRSLVQAECLSYHQLPMSQFSPLVGMPCSFWRMPGWFLHGFCFWSQAGQNTNREHLRSRLQQKPGNSRCPDFSVERQR